MPYHYVGFGLHLQTTRPLPGLAQQPAGARTDLYVYLGAMPAWRRKCRATHQTLWYVSEDLDDRAEPALRVWVLKGTHFLLAYSDGTEFVVDRAGTRIWTTWPDMLTPEDTATYLLGPVLGFALRLRGTFCLHGSAVAVGPCAVALVGPPGAGKSTTAAAFARRGLPVISDDVVAIREDGGEYCATPSYPHLRLWPDSSDMLFGSQDALPRISPTHPSWDKRYLDLAQPGYAFVDSPLPLKAIYILNERVDRSAAPLVGDLPPREAFITIVRNGYAGYLLDAAMHAEAFQQVSGIVSRVRIRAVTPHVDSNRLEDLCDVILEDVRSFALAVA